MSSPSLFVRAQEQLRSYIQELGLGPGDRLPSEGDLAERFGLSRGAIREATRSLQTLGVITALHGDGLYVSEFSFRPIIEQLPYGLAYGDPRFSDVLQAREALETGLMPAVSSLVSAEDLDECVRLTGLMADLEQAGEPTKDVDRDFHLTLYRSLDSVFVNNLIETFWDLFGRLEKSLPAPAGTLRLAPLHLAVVEALRSDDADLAMHRMREHFDDVRARSRSAPL